MADLAATVVLVAVSTTVVVGTVAAKAMVVVASQNFSVRCVLSMATLHRFVFFGLMQIINRTYLLCFMTLHLRAMDLSLRVALILGSRIVIVAHSMFGPTTITNLLVPTLNQILVL